MSSEPKIINSLSLGFSPCPNDTFIFDALVNGKINSGGLTFHPQLEDVETLNRRALNGELDITKISFAVYTQIFKDYELLNAGSALGNGVGPLFISKKEFTDPAKEIKTIAIPGKHTTAYFLFRIFYPELKGVTEMVFSDIEQAIIDEKVDAGVIIHENRFTYEKRGLKKICDLGDLWESQTSQPIPLGGIAVRRSLDLNIKKKISSLVKQSVEFAFKHPEESSEYVRIHAQEMSEEVRKKHIALYVNDFSVDLGKDGRKAVMAFLRAAGVSEFPATVFI